MKVKMKKKKRWGVGGGKYRGSMGEEKRKRESKFHFFTCFCLQVYSKKFPSHIFISFSNKINNTYKFIFLDLKFKIFQIINIFNNLINFNNTYVFFLRV